MHPLTICFFIHSSESGEFIHSSHAFNNIILGQTLKTWTLHIVNDNRYEGTEDFQLRLSDPVLGILEYPQISNFFITDPEDGKLMQY